MNIAKLLLVLLSMLSLSACDPSAQNINYPVLPSELKDCTFHHLFNGSVSIYVTRCPNSTTSTKYASGKSSQTAVVIDGVEYVKKETP